MTPSVAVAAVTFDRPSELAVLMDGINNHTAPVQSICLVDSGTVPSTDVAGQHPNVDYVRSEANLGGAGGFSLAILKAVASGADWIWMMDDDAEPADPDCLATLLREARERDLKATTDLLTDALGDAEILVFPGIDGATFAARAGWPSIVLPAGYTANSRRPVGILFVGRRWSDDRLLQLAYAFEQAHPVRRPPAAINPAVFRGLAH